jgi:hypothetical protein
VQRNEKPNSRGIVDIQRLDVIGIFLILIYALYRKKSICDPYLPVCCSLAVPDRYFSLTLPQAGCASPLALF